MTAAFNAAALSPDAALVKAARERSLAAAEAALDAGADPNLKDWAGETPLIVALENDATEIAQLLLGRGADTETVFGSSKPFSSGFTPLLWAVQNKDAGLAEKLLEAGADPDARTPRGDTPLLLAARMPDADNIIALLLRHKAKPGLASRSGETPLMESIRCFNNAAIEMLAAAGAPLEDQDTYGRTALMTAAAQQRGAEAVGILLRHGAKLETRDNRGETALMKAAGFSGNSNAAELLIDAGADLSARGEGGKTLLMSAVTYQHVVLAEKLLAAGVPLDDVNDAGETAGDIAAQKTAAARREGDEAKLAAAMGMQYIVTATPAAQACAARDEERRRREAAHEQAQSRQQQLRRKPAAGRPRP